MKRKKILLSLLASIVATVLFLIVHPSTAAARELPSGMLIGDNHGITVKKDGTYLVEVNDVMPGKTWHTTISLINMEKDVPYHLTMLVSKPTVSGSLDLSESIQMKINYGDKVVYEGPASGKSSQNDLQKDPLDLGTFHAGDSRALKVEYSLSGKYTNEDFSQKNIMENVWLFHAVKTDETLPPTGGDSSGPLGDLLKPWGSLPSTGEAIRQSVLFTCLGLFFLLLVLLRWKADKLDVKTKKKIRK